MSVPPNEASPHTPASEPGRPPLPPPASGAPFSFGRIVWPVLLSLVVLVVIGYFTYEPDAFQEMLARLNPWFLAAAVASVVLRVLFGGWRLSFISHGHLSISAGIRGQLAWDFFSNVTPSAIGGGPVAAVYIARDQRIPVGEATALMLFSMLMDQLWFALSIPIVLVASAFVEVIPTSLGTIGTTAFLLYFVGMLFWVVAFGYATMFRPDLLQRFADWIFRVKWLRRFRERVANEMGQLQERARMLRSQPLSFYIYGLLFTFGTWISRYVLALFIVWSVYDDFDKVLFMLRTAAMTLGTLVLPTPGGSGGVEGLYALFLAPLMPKTLVAPTLLLWRILGYYLFVALGIFLSTHYVHKSIRRKRRDAAALRAARDEDQGTKRMEG